MEPYANPRPRWVTNGATTSDLRTMIGCRHEAATLGTRLLGTCWHCQARPTCDRQQGGRHPYSPVTRRHKWNVNTSPRGRTHHTGPPSPRDERLGRAGAGPTRHCRSGPTPPRTRQVAEDHHNPTPPARSTARREPPPRHHVPGPPQGGRVGKEAKARVLRAASPTCEKRLRVSYGMRG